VESFLKHRTAQKVEEEKRNLQAGEVQELEYVDVHAFVGRLILMATVALVMTLTTIQSLRSAK